MTGLDTLRRKFDFTGDDLAANRAGRLTERQQRRLLAAVESACAGWMAGVVVFVVLVASLVAYFGVVLSQSDALGPLVCLLIVGWLLGTAVLSAGVWYGVHWVILRLVPPAARPAWCPPIYRPRYQAITDGRVESMSGLLTTRDDGEHIDLLLDDQVIATNYADTMDERLWSLEQGQRYTIYYVPVVTWLVAIEPLQSRER